MKYQEEMIDWKELDRNTLFKLQRQTTEKNSTVRKTMRFLKNLLLKEHTYDVDLSSKPGSILFFYSPDYYRYDHVGNFDKVVACCDNASVFRGIKREKKLINISLLAGARRVCLIPSLLKWHRERWKDVPFFQLVPFYFMLEDLWKFLAEFDLINFSALVVYYDSWVTDAAMVQLFKTMHKKTATMQHAFFAAKTDKSVAIGETGLELQCSNADFFLAWNEVTLLEAKKQGVDTEKFRILGIPKFIGSGFSERQANCREKKHIFGVVLGVKDNERQNIEMIKLANMIARKYEYKYVLKYHPAFSGTEYKSYTDSEYYIGNVEKACGLEEYAANFDFSIAGNSTVMMELLYLRHRVFHYTNKALYDKYSEMQEISFSNIEEFRKIFQVENGIFEKVRIRYCGPEDSKQNYENFFAKELVV